MKTLKEIFSKTCVKEYRGEIKWTTSRAADTYGWNVCTLYIDGKKVARACGGGYDMVDSVFSDWLNNTYSARIDAYCNKKKAEPYSNNMPGSKKISEPFRDGHFFHYGEFSRGGHWHLDGGNGCSIDSIAKIGIVISEIKKFAGRGGCRGTGIYTITDNKAAKK